MNMARLIRLALYYGLARHLPASSSRYTRWARVVRSMICHGLFESAGKNINIESGAFFGSGKDIRIGDNSGVGVNCSIHGKVCIGKDVMIGPDVVILTTNHAFSSISVPMIQQGYGESRPVVIEDDVWIGMRAIIMPGVTLARGTIVGAGSVVTKNTSPYSVVAGNPAKVIATRGGGDA